MLKLFRGSRNYLFVFLAKLVVKWCDSSFLELTTATFSEVQGRESWQASPSKCSTLVCSSQLHNADIGSPENPIVVGQPTVGTARPVATAPRPGATNQAAAAWAAAPGAGPRHCHTSRGGHNGRQQHNGSRGARQHQNGSRGGQTNNSRGRNRPAQAPVQAHRGSNR